MTGNEGSFKMDRIGIDALSVFGLPPVDFVNMSADLGCRYVSIALQPMGKNLHGVDWSLRDPATRREMVAAMQDRGISISLGEGLAVMPDRDVRDLAGDLAAMAELGAKRIATVSTDPDISRTCAQFAVLAEMANSMGMELVVEFIPHFPIADLPTAVDVVRQVDLPYFRILTDTMHLGRTGATVSDIRALDPAMIGYIQLCDVPLKPTCRTYMQEAMYDRMAPGTGELPLLDYLCALPNDRVIGLEIPMLALAEAGVGPHERLGPCVEAARQLLAQIELEPSK
jgi:sugar phosphate isomerase/epimerase